MMEPTRFSIITVVRNDPVGVIKTLQSVFSQSHSDYEVIVQDGASTDGTDRVVGDLIVGRSNCHYHRLSEKGGVDLDYCREIGVPVIRREVGGGAVYLDGDQLFTQWIFRAEHLPATVEERFRLYIETLVRTYRTLGIAAEYRPINDIHVAGRKIGGTGAARMDRAMTIVRWQYVNV